MPLMPSDDRRSAARAERQQQHRRRALEAETLRQRIAAGKNLRANASVTITTGGQSSRTVSSDRTNSRPAIRRDRCVSK